MIANNMFGFWNSLYNWDCKKRKYTA